MKTETHLIDTDNHLYRTKIDLFKNQNIYYRVQGDLLGQMRVLMSFG